MVAQSFIPRLLPSDWLLKLSVHLIGSNETGWTLSCRTDCSYDKMADLAAASLCFCTERNSVHVHCPCQECRGKPVNYKTQERHLSALRLLQQENSKFILLLNVQKRLYKLTEFSIDPSEQLARCAHYGHKIGIGLQFETCFYIFLLTEVNKYCFTDKRNDKQRKNSPIQLVVSMLFINQVFATGVTNLQLSSCRVAV